MLRVDSSFFCQDVLEVAPRLLGMHIVRMYDDGTLFKYRICEVEIYRGEEDEACHASGGLTPRTRVMYERGGFVYVYLIYGVYWMLNIVTGEKNRPQAILIRGVEGVNGPGRVGKRLAINSSFYGEDLDYSNRIWLESDGEILDFYTCPRIGVDYAGDYWRNIEWRYILKT